MKYVLELRPREGQVNPVCSARGDASAIVRGEGYEPIYLGHPNVGSGLVRRALTVLDYTRLRLTVRKGDTVFMQWPPGVPGARLLQKIITPPRGRIADLGA